MLKFIIQKKQPTEPRGPTSDLRSELCTLLDLCEYIFILVLYFRSENALLAPKGEPENFMKDEEFISKFKGLTEPYLSNERVNQLTDLMLKIDQSNNVNSIFEYSQIDL